MSEPECFCGRPASRGYLCQGCATKLRRDLATIRDLWAETGVELTRQAKKSRGGTRSRGGAFPLPVSWNAVQDRETIANTVTTWLRMNRPTPDCPRCGKPLPFTFDDWVRLTATSGKQLDHCPHCRVAHLIEWEYGDVSVWEHATWEDE